MANLAQFKVSKMKEHLPGLVHQAESFRKDPDGPLDVSLAEVLENSDHEVKTMSALYTDLGINPSVDTLENLFTLPDPSVRWLLPEIFRDAIQLGLRRAPIYPNIIAAEQTIKQLTATIPHWNMSDAQPNYVGVAETIGLGTVSYGSKQITLRKLGRGIKIPYEVRQYVSVDVVSIFLRDFGIKLGMGIDTLMIDVLLNGEQSNGSESAPVIGIAVPGTLVYKDLLRVWVRMSRIGRRGAAIIGGEDAAITTLDLPEFKTKYAGTTQAQLNLKTPVPNEVDYYIHGRVPANQQIIVDTSSAIIKYNAQPLLVEAEKIVSNQTEATYATLTTGFGIMMRDARVVLDSSLAFSSNGFPSYMDPTSQEIVIFQ